MNVQSISTNDIFLQHDSDYDSLSNMSSPVISEFSDIVASSNDGSDALPTLPTGLSDGTTSNPGLPIEMLPALESFIPIIERLPGLVLENNTYYVDGPLVEAELEQLISYTRRIGELTLTDTLPTSHPYVAHETLTRLALIQDPKSPFLSSLECLRLIDADESLSYLFFCISSSLKSLEIVGAPLTRQTTISSFLQELALRVPELSNITLRGRISERSLRSSLKFNHLRQLHLIDAAEALDFSFLQDISALPELESLIIDARMAKYKQLLVSADNAPLASATNSIGDPYLSSSAEDQMIIATDSNTVLFRRLRKLAITSNIVLMEDLIYRLSPCGVKEVSLTLVQRYSPEPPNIARITNGADIDLDDPLYAMSIEELKWIADQHPVSRRWRGRLQKNFTTINGEELLLTLDEEQRYRDHLAECLKEQQEQKKSFATAQTLSFATVIEKVLTFGASTSFVIDHADMSSQPTFAEEGFPLEFPSTTFETLLSYPNLKKLRITRWALPSMERSIVDSTSTAHAASLMSMQKLQLPVDKTSNTGITMSTLDLIARYYPHLTYLECFIQIPPTEAIQLDLGVDVIPHGLEILSVGGEVPDKISVATYLSLLFPHLKDIQTHEGYDENDWQYIHTLVKMCHTVSLAREKRLHGVAH